MNNQDKTAMSDQDKALNLENTIKSKMRSVEEKSDRINPETLVEIAAEYHRAVNLHGHFRSIHEGHSVMREEFDELWDEIKKRNPDRAALKEEAIQIAAMACKFIDDFCR